MQDKPAQQQRLSHDLASLIAILQAPVVLPFLRAFWLTISREWGQIEALRLDKYLYLIRQYLNASFRYLSKDNWGDKGMIEEFTRILEETPFNPTDMKIPNGLRYHVLDIYVDELEKVGGGESEWEVRRDILDVLMNPVEKLAKEGTLKVVRVAAKETLEDERILAWRGQKGGKDEEEWGGIQD